jgi:uncharacterized membrane protein YgaE (UPF0421/DUF939 family)
MTNSLQWKPTPFLLRFMLALLGFGFAAIGVVIFVRFPFARSARVGAVVTIAVGLAGLVRAVRDNAKK